ncbi:MAG: hypothetical protein HY320_10100 [Armatimonadetes bacterium]|nr:hypothetical protein [Armatimonadota bacterium]
MKRLWMAAALLVALAALWLGLASHADGQRPRGTDTEQIYALLAQGAAAASRHDAAGVQQLISENYHDELFTAIQARMQVARVLREHPTLRVIIPDRSVQVQLEPDGKHARLVFQLTLVAEGGETPYHSESQIFLKLAKEPVRYLWLFPGEEWKVVFASGYATDL